MSNAANMDSSRQPLFANTESKVFEMVSHEDFGLQKRVLTTPDQIPGVQHAKML